MSIEEIRNVAVLGSGVMGAGIAALLANAGCDVMLFDIVPDGAGDRSMLARQGIEKQRKAKPASGFTHPRNAKRVKAKNLEDDLGDLATCDWIIEAVLEDVRVKHKVYAQIDAHRKAGCIVSSNTSTLPLSVLIEGMPEHFSQDFCITHFFNPPRFLPLLELTGGESCTPAHLDRLEHFADIRLGKGVVRCKDTPGFLANRIGIFWMMAGLLKALEHGISVEDADAVMGKPLGVPKTALFGLFDLIGIDLMPHIAKAMLATLPKGDRFRELYEEPALVRQMIDEGYTGRKGKGGFYCMEKQDGRKVKLAKSLSDGSYAPAKKSTLESLNVSKAHGLAGLVAHEDVGGVFAKDVLVHTLHYAASLVPEISDDILNIDAAMRLGFAWTYGPFELIDKLGDGNVTGAAWLAQACQEAGLDVPPILEAARAHGFYREEAGHTHYITQQGEYAAIDVPPHAYMLRDAVRGASPVLRNGSAQLWDIGDGIACLQYTTKMNTMDDGVLEMIGRSIEKVGAEFQGLVIASDDDKFSLGANLGFFMYLANLADWRGLSSVIQGGQRALMGLKYAPFPVVASLSGMALGGGCETILHCDAVQAHIESYPGLVEVGVGVIPGWGGCKEMLLRGFNRAQVSAGALAAGRAPARPMAQGAMPVVTQAFETIMLAKVASSAEEAQDLGMLNDHSRITMNRQRVLPDAKALCLSLAKDYAPPQPTPMHLPGASGHAALMMAIDGFRQSGKATPHDAVIGEHLAHVLTGGGADILDEVSEQDILQLEHDHFIELVKSTATRARIQHMLETNKPLRN